MPYSDRPKRRMYAKSPTTGNPHSPPSLEEPRLYWVVIGLCGPVITQCPDGAVVGVLPMTLTDAIAAYVKAGGLAIDLDLE